MKKIGDFYIPDNVFFAFNKSYVRCKKDGLKKIFVHLGCGDAQYDATGIANDGVAMVDVSAYVQSMFDDSDYSFFYLNEDALKIDTGRTISFHCGYELEDGTVAKGVAQGNSFCIWGALTIGETFGKEERYTAWESYPFSFPAFIYSPGKISVNRNGESVKVQSVGAIGMYAVPMPFDMDEGLYIINNKTAEIAETTFANLYDYTFLTKEIGNEDVEICTIDVREYRDGVYLRWIDRHGRLRYWLFERGDESRTVSTDGEFIRNNSAGTMSTSTMLGISGRRKGYEVERSIELCASLVDSETYDMLQDITTSPVVDLYIGDEFENWTSVTIKEGTYQKTRAVLQDFVCNMVLNDIKTQRL